VNDEHPERVETLAALAARRASVDSSAEDPREELAFHNALKQLARVLDQTPGSDDHSRLGRNAGGVGQVSGSAREGCPLRDP
jgi:hypothetical protein